MAKTFDDARNALLKKYDQQTASLRLILQKTDWVNSEWGDIVAAHDRIRLVVEAVARLNRVEAEN